MTDRELIEMAYKAMDSVNDHSSGGGLYRGCFDEELHHLKKRLLQKNFVSPPQRERVKFPTMLRKMWSGTEVQAWLDENVNKEAE